ncbi:sensor histidine kinase [Kocuria marina]|uniref:sensor histidine kinase n=1 Tax=Kocuria marina TaxID=223184 RepID=UPI0011A9BE0B|nr:histidine kinase [Kocuria indica]
MPSWLRVVVVLFAAVALLDDLRSMPWSFMPPAPAVLSSSFLVLSYGAVALLAWSPLASAVAITLSYVLAMVLHDYALALLCGCVVMVAVLAMLSRGTALAHLAITATWMVVSAGVLRNSDFVWTVGIPLGVSALIGAAVRFFVTQYRLNTRRLAVLEVTHQRLREQERLALARDLHDVVAHELTLVTMQAAGSHRQQDPGELHRTIDMMDSAARSGLHELRTLLHILRDSPGAPDERDSSSGLTTGSLYGVARALAASLERAALVPELELGDGLDEIPTSIRGTAARVLQEASTNMIKYAPTGSRCALRVFVRDGAVHVHAENQIRRGAGTDSGRRELTSAFGLRGIQERVALLNGQVEYGPRNAVWHLDVRIPVA